MSNHIEACETASLLELKTLFSGKEQKVRFERKFCLPYALDDVKSSGDLHVVGTLSDYSGVLQFQAEFDFPYTAVCARCLKEVACHLTFTLDGPVKPEPDEDGEETVYARDDVIDLAELALIGVDEHLPVKHLCSDACKGLCPYCGTDLNEAPCTCKKPPDPRLAGLAEFFNE